MGLSDKSIKEFQRIFKENYNHPVSYEEAEEYGSRLVGFFQLLHEMHISDEKKKNRLKESPKGFPLKEESTYNCCICYRSVTGEEGWYDKYGNKCLDCQRALDKKVIPGYICKDRDSFYLTWELKDKFGIHPATAKKMVREGKLKARVIKNKHDKVHEYIFIRKENIKL
jgi:hypothetical protein